MPITHNFVSAIPDSIDASIVKPSNWNDIHNITNFHHHELQGLADDDHIQYLLINGTRAMTGDLIPTGSGALDLGGLLTEWKTLYVNNQNGIVIDCPTAIGKTLHSNYIFDMGGGGNQVTEGGDFTFRMDACVGACENSVIFDLGNVYWAGANFFNRFKIQSYTGLRTYAFVAAFGGFNNPDYGWELQYISGLANIAKILFFDNQTAAGINRSIDFRINKINKLTIENDGTVVVSDRITTPLITATVINNGAGIGTAGAPGITLNGYPNFFGLNWFDYLTINAVTTNLPSCLGMFPNGTATASYLNVYNSSNTGATAWLETGVRGAIAELVVRDFAQITNITSLNIGSGGNDFPTFDVTCTTLTDINFIFAGVTELTIQPNTLIFNNGAIDTQMDWATNGELGLQVATNDIIRISAILAHIYQDLNVDGNVKLTADNDMIILGGDGDVNIYYDGTDFYIDSSIVAPSDINITCGANKTVELQNVVWDDLRIVPGAFEFAGVSDPTLENWQPGGSGTTFKIWKFKENDEVFFTCQIPHTYKQGTNILAHVHWTPADRGNEENGNTVAWKLDYSWANIDGTFSPSSTVSMVDVCDGTDDKHQMTPTATITGTGKTISSMLICRLWRDSVGDTWAGITGAQSPGLLEFDLHFQINTVGSRQELIK